MNTTTTAITLRTGRPALVLLLALLVLFTTVAPALAAPPAAPDGLTLQPAGPDPTAPADIAVPGPDPDPDPHGADDLSATPVDPGPTNPEDLTQVETEPPAPEPTVTLEVAPHCAPEPGLTYAIEVVSPPQGALAYKAQWRGDDGVVHTVAGQSGTIATGEGAFEIRGMLHHQGPGFYATDFVDVVIDCADDTPDDLPRPGTPNFTG